MYGMNRTDLSSEQKSKKIQHFLDLATQHHKAGNLPKAKGIYRKILQDDPNQPVALHLLGVIAYQAGKHEQAIEYITRALHIKPDYAEAHNNLGTVLKELGHVDDAISQHRNSLSSEIVTCKILHQP